MEQELKLGLVHPEALDDLLAALPRPRAVCEQTNHYFVDEAGHLASTRTMLRVRESRPVDSGGPITVVLTVKRRLVATDGYFVAEETECALDPAAWEDVRSGGRDLASLDATPLAGLGVDTPLRCHGVMRNTRHVIACGGFTLEVDRTELPGGRVDAEVEVETGDPEGARSLVQARAEAAGVALFPQTTGKYARFIASLAG